MDNRYLEMIRRVEPHLGERIPPNKYIAEDLRHKIATSPWTINFDQVSDTYNAFFWKRNFWKAAYFFSYEYSLTAVTLNRLRDRQNLDVTVVGSGAGSDVLALMTWFNSAFPLTKLTLTLIDQSQKQLDKMALLIKETTELINQIHVSVRYLHMDSEQWQPAVDSADVLVLSHFLVENPSDVHTVLLKTKDAVRPGGDIVIMERPDETVLHHAKQILANIGLTVYDTTTDDERVELIKKSLTDLGNTGISSHYLRATQPDDKHKAEIVSKYFEAWREQAIEPISDICNANASFDYKPGVRAPVSGIDNIRAYWKREPLTQSNIKLLIRNISYTENVSICVFEGDFDTPVDHVVIKGAHCFNIDTYTNKLKHLSGHYGVVKTPL